MRQPGFDRLRKRLLEFLDLFRDCFQSCDVFYLVVTALLISNHCEAFSQRLRQIDQRIFHLSNTGILPVSSSGHPACTGDGRLGSLRDVSGWKPELLWLRPPARWFDWC